jgi:hypothetical protein
MGPESGDEEVACQSQLGGVITTGGGFSTYYAAPDWQTDAVAGYFAGLKSNQEPSDGYNPNGRAYPDISIIGVQYQVMVQGRLVSLFGTSASSPVLAAMISLVNAARQVNNMTSVGFLNPTLYAYGAPTNTSVSPFNDVTSGDNKCLAYNGANPSYAICCPSGFEATYGWDPVTGWGSITYPNLANMYGIEATYTGGDDDDDSSGGGGGGKKLSTAVVIVIVVFSLLAVIAVITYLIVMCCSCGATTAAAGAASAGPAGVGGASAGRGGGVEVFTMAQATVIQDNPVAVSPVHR